MNRHTLIAILNTTADSLEPVRLRMQDGGYLKGYVREVSADQEHVFLDSLSFMRDFGPRIADIRSITIGQEVTHA